MLKLNDINSNLISNILSYLTLYEISTIIDYIHSKDQVLLGVAFYNSLSFKLVKGKIYNYQRRCASCYNILKYDWALIIGKENCDNCLSCKHFNLECCNNCTKKNIKRGELEYKYCKFCKNSNVLIGLNLLS
tara:strand:- start:558 stop:953 length:396 start_codon:yes stop_codon:yes gene_type:complete